MGFFDFIKRKQSLLQSGVLQGATDRHSHILFGVDDGIRTLEDSLAVLVYCEEVGIKEVWCTPHIMEDVQNTTEGLRERFAQLQQAYQGPIKLHLAAEYMLDTLFEERFKAGDLLTMEDNTILVETSTWNPPTDMTGTLRRIQKAGYRPLLAHPERYRYLTEPGYERLHKMGVHFQMNLGSLVGYYGETAMGKAHDLLEKGWYSEVGSDCHRLATIQEQYTREVLTKDIASRLSLTNRH
jgi:tyrosine-protein phosphatase YwqE